MIEKTLHCKHTRRDLTRVMHNPTGFNKNSLRTCMFSATATLPKP